MGTTLKILLIGSLPPPYHGSSIYLKTLLNSRIKEVFEVIHLDTSDHRDDLDNLGKADFINVFFALKNFLQLTRILLTKKPDLVYVIPSQGLAYIREGIFVVLTKTLSNAKVIEHMHGSFFDTFFSQSGGLFRWFISFTQKRVDYAIVLGDKLTNLLARWIPAGNVFVAHNGVDFSVELNGKFSTSVVPSLCFLGNLLKFKGFIDAVSSLKFIKQNRGDVKLNIAGEWAYDPIFAMTAKQIQEEFERTVTENDLKRNVVFWGPAYGSRKTSLLEGSHIFLYPTLNDGLPLVLLEAMAAGCPVITTDVGAISEVVIDGETGFIVEKSDPQAIAGAAAKMIEDPELRIKMGKAARKRYEECFTLEKNIDKIIEIFSKVLGKKAE